MSSTVNHGAVQETTRISTFQHLQSTFTSTQRPRPPLMDPRTGHAGENPVPLKVVKLPRKESKGGLRGIFARNKAEKNAVVPVLDGPVLAAAISETLLPISEKDPDSIRRTNTPPDATLPEPATPKTTGRSYRMNLRSKSLKQNKPQPKASPKPSTKSSPRPPTRSSAAWDPPPLFQAYSQAIKHAQLSASTLSADSILRVSNHKRNNSLRDEIAQVGATADAQDPTAVATKAEKANSKHRRQLSGSVSKTDWTVKIFVLVTSGYLLQYAGEGSFDRLPEKMMQLGKDSVAFASDVIPGKHWVLQISQSMDADGTPTPDTRSLLSRLAFRGADYRRSATSLLLVLDSAEDMDSWIAVVRREIEALGGKKHVSETGKAKPDDNVMQFKARPNLKYLVQRDTDQFFNPPSLVSPSFGSPSWMKDNWLEETLDDAPSAPAKPQSTIRPSTGHRSITNSVISHDGHQLENLRDSMSYSSSGHRTLITSQSSSAGSSPTRGSMSTFDDFPRKVSNEDIWPRPNVTAINGRRRSTQTIQISMLEALPAHKNVHNFAFGVPTRQSRSHSSPSPPATAPRRFSSARGFDTEAPPVPTLAATSPNRPLETPLNGTRKPLPARPLSPVEDSPSAERGHPAFTPMESSFDIAEHAKTSMIDVRPFATNPPTPPPTSRLPLPRRMSSLMPLGSSEAAGIQYQFPGLIPSVQALRDTAEKMPAVPSRPAPTPPAALTTPLPISPYVPVHEPQEAVLFDETEKEILSPLPVLANTKQKLRRPTSMQIRTTNPYPSFTTKSAKSPAIASPNRLSKTDRYISVSPSTASSATIGNALTPLSACKALTSPAFQRMPIRANQKSVANRRSMPALMNGPPPAPPPDCALPSLPPLSAGLRNSVQV